MAAMAAATGHILSDETTRDQRRLVIGAAYKYGPDQVRVFVESLRATGYAGDVIMLTGRLQLRLKAYLRQHGVRPFPHWSTRRLHGPIQAHRFARFAGVLESAASRYDQVVVSDVKDVLFQRHPFADIRGPGCRFYLEAAPWTIATEPTNRRWAELFLGADEFAAISPCRVSCCGVVLGDAENVAAYLTRLAGYLQALPRELRLEGGADTVFHNKMAHLTHEVPGTIVENDEHVATMGISPPGTYVVGADGLIRTADGHLPAILHQYDRLPEIAQIVAAKYGLSS